MILGFWGALRLGELLGIEWADHGLTTDLLLLPSYLHGARARDDVEVDVAVPSSRPR